MRWIEFELFGYVEDEYNESRCFIGLQLSVQYIGGPHVEVKHFGRREEESGIYGLIVWAECT